MDGKFGALLGRRGLVAGLIGLLVLCVVPLLFVGPDPWVTVPQIAWMEWGASGEVPEAYFSFLGGAFTHTVMLLITGAVAGCGALLSLARAVVRASMLTTVLTIVLFWSAFVFLIQGLTVESSYFFAYDYVEFVPFTWFVTRGFAVLLLTLGGVVLLWKKPHVFWTRPRSILLVFLVVGGLSVGVIWLAASIQLPQVVYPERVVTRPLEIPLALLMLVNVGLVYPRVYLSYRTPFALALWVGLVPFVAAEFYLIFGSRYLFDDVFNSAYALIGMSYGIVFAGLVWDYSRSMLEEGRLQEEMVKVDRMVTIGTMAAGVGHEIKNPLSYVVTNLEWALEGFQEEEPEEIRAALESAKMGAERIAMIVEDIKVLSQFQPTPVEAIEVAGPVELALRMTAAKVRGDTYLEKELEPGVEALADESRLAQVVMNLVMNAYQAVKDQPVGARRMGVRLFEEGQEAVIEVWDNGPGVDRGLREKIFEPFYTTKEVGEGTGLGLSLSRQIVESFGGRLELVESEEGARFQVRLKEG